MVILGVVLLLVGLLVALPYPLNTILIILGAILIVVGLWHWFGPLGPRDPTVPRRRWY